MQKPIRNRIIASFSLAALIVGCVGMVSLSYSQPAAAAIDPWAQITEGWTQAGGDTSTGARTLPQYVQLIINALLFIIGAVAVIMIIVGGIRYVTSGGDANAATSARNTIMYAVVGLIVAALAYALVQFVISIF